jgi:hypothetical protein
VELKMLWIPKKAVEIAGYTFDEIMIALDCCS